MVEIPKDHETALDIVWACYRDDNERWLRSFPNTKGATRSDVVAKLGWSYSTVHRLTDELVKRGQLIVSWDHQHQSYWEGHFRTLGEHAVAVKSSGAFEGR